MCSQRVFVERAVESYCTPHTLIVLLLSHLFVEEVYWNLLSLKGEGYALILSLLNIVCEYSE